MEINNANIKLKKIYTTNGNLVYDGEVQNDLPNGNGRLFFQGKIVEGTFKDGKLNGEIKITDIKNKTVEYVQYKDGIPLSI